MSNRTADLDLTGVTEAFCARLSAEGRSPATIAAYRRDLALVARVVVAEDAAHGAVDALGVELGIDQHVADLPVLGVGHLLVADLVLQRALLAAQGLLLVDDAALLLRAVHGLFVGVVALHLGDGDEAADSIHSHDFFSCSYPVR